MNIAVYFMLQPQQNYRKFFVNHPSHCRNLSLGPGISTGIVIGEQQFLLLDDRSYRQRQGSRDPHAHWGAEQETWFIDRIQNHDGPTWLFNGSQFFPQMPFKESVSGDHPVQFENRAQRPWLRDL